MRERVLYQAIINTRKSFIAGYNKYAKEFLRRLYKL